MSGRDLPVAEVGNPVFGVFKLKAGQIGNKDGEVVVASLKSLARQNVDHTREEKKE
jgi:hypothetical protein